MFCPHKKIIFFSFFLILALFSCNKNSRNPVARFYHNTTSYFNYYYNASTLTKEKIKEIDRTYPLPHVGFAEIHHYGDDEEMKSHQPDFDKIIKKVEVMAYKHPNCRSMDNGRLVQGKALFFKGQYLRAIKNFEDIFAKYSGTKITPDVYLWLAKTYYYMDNKEMTHTILTESLIERADKPFKKWFRAELAIFRAQMSIDKKDYKLAAKVLEENVGGVRGKLQKAKTHYLLGQLYQELKQCPEAIAHFKKTEKLSDDYAVTFKSKLQQARLMGICGGEIGEAYSYLYKMEKDEKNIEYLDQIYYELANLELKRNDTEGVLGYLKKSVASATSNPRQKALSFYKLGQIYFYNRKNYDKAGMYFDSAALAIAPTEPEYNEIKLIQSTLKDYVLYKTTIEYQDSMLWLATLSPKAIETEIDKAIAAAAEKKRKEEEARLLAEEEANSGGNNPLDPFATNLPTGGGWSFDDPAKVSEDRLKFQQFWGNRKNEDHWRRKTKEAVIAVDEPETQDTVVAVVLTKEDSVLQEKFGDNFSYYKDIPFEEKQKKEAHLKIENALFKLGNIYDQKLAQVDSAIRTFETLIRRYPQTKHILPTRYSLYKLYKGKNNNSNIAHRDYILNEHPKTIYALLIKGASPEEIAEQTQDFQGAYKGLFTSYHNRQYETAIGFSDYLLSQYGDRSDVKLDQVYYLRAMSFGYIGYKDSLKRGLVHMINTYTDSPIRPLAQRTLDALNATGLILDPLAPPTSPQSPVASTEKGATPSTAPTKLDKSDPRFKDFKTEIKPNTQFYILFYLNPSTVTENMGKDLLMEFGQEKFKDKNVVAVNYENPDNKKYQVFYVNKFNSEFEASEYLYQLYEAGLTDLFQVNPEDKIMFITQENFSTAFGKRRLEDYILFYDNIITR